jgi:Flp pilus assembly pilin Flp
VKVSGGRRANVRLFVWRSLHEDDGQDLVEYAFLIAFIALLCILGIQNLGTAINDTYHSVSTSLVDSVS